MSQDELIEALDLNEDEDSGNLYYRVDIKHSSRQYIIILKLSRKQDYKIKVTISQRHGGMKKKQPPVKIGTSSTVVHKMDKSKIFNLVKPYATGSVLFRLLEKQVNSLPAAHGPEWNVFNSLHALVTLLLSSPAV